jgi:hypothetical protein
MHAVNAWNFDAIKLLVTCGARIEETDFLGRSTIQKAKDRQLDAIASYLESEVVQQT